MFCSGTFLIQRIDAAIYMNNFHIELDWRFDIIQEILSNRRRFYVLRLNMDLTSLFFFCSISGKLDLHKNVDGFA